MLSIPLIPLSLLVGLALGSFVSALAWRIPRGESFLVARSRCTSCQNPLGVTELIPLFSWLWQKAQCRSCKSPIPFRYPFIEILMSVLTLILVYRFGITFSTLLLLGLTVVLLIEALIDLDHGILPDGLQACAFMFGLLYHLLPNLLPTLHWDGANWGDATSSLPDQPLFPYLIASAVAFALGLALHYGYRRLRGKDGLGLGDVKFLAVAGLWLGIDQLPMFLFLSGLLGIFTSLVTVRAKLETPFPFGPALAAALWLTLVMPFDFISVLTFLGM